MIMPVRFGNTQDFSGLDPEQVERVQQKALDNFEKIQDVIGGVISDKNLSSNYQSYWTTLAVAATATGVRIDLHA